MNVIYLCVNKVAPDYAGVELGIGDALLVKAIMRVFEKERENRKLLMIFKLLVGF